MVAGDQLNNKLDKLYLSKAWVDARLIEFGLVESETGGDDIEEPKAKTKDAPSILVLKKQEKLTDDEGNVYDIEIRGERHPDKIFFKVKDVSMMIESKHLSRNILKDASGYARGEDYVKLRVVDDDGPHDHNRPKSGGSKCKLFFTYAGFLRSISNAKNKNTTKFRKWVTNVVFTAHLGTKSQKQGLAAKLIGVDRQTVRAVLSKSTTEQSCIYLIYLGKAKDLTTTFKIKDYEPNESIYKFGRAISLSKRMDQHAAKYNQLGCNVELVTYAPIDPTYNNDAENDIKEYFTNNNHRVINKEYIELVSLDNTKNKYKEISVRYMGKYTELNNKIKVIEQKCRADIAEANNEANQKVSEANNKLLKQKLRYNKKLRLLELKLAKYAPIFFVCYSSYT